VKLGPQEQRRPDLVGAVLERRAVPDIRHARPEPR